jgi:hypothetical protein
LTKSEGKTNSRAPMKKSRVGHENKEEERKEGEKKKEIGVIPKIHCPHKPSRNRGAAEIILTPL